jgi:hypothetical protein
MLVLVRLIVPWCSQDPAEFVGEACVLSSLWKGVWVD